MDKSRQQVDESLREQERRKEEALVPKKVNNALNVGT